MTRSEQTAAQVSKPMSEALRRLKLGQITLDEYLDEQAERAISHLVDHLSAAELDSVRQIMREELRTNPVMVEYLRRATGLEHRPELAE